MKLHRILPCLALGLLAAACSGIAEPYRTNAMNLSPNPDRFQQELAAGYGKLGSAEYNEEDWWAARLMYRKSAEAGSGQVVPLGEPKEWQQIRGLPWPGVPAKAGKVGLEGRAYLTAVDYRSRILPWIEANKQRNPVGTADMQVRFECWLAEVSEDDDAGANQCGLNLALLTMVTTAQTTVTPAPVPAPAPVAMPPKTYLVFFDFDRSEITPEAASIIRQAADDAKRGNVRLIVATGHADRSGSNDYNQRLSERRANAVKGALIREGIAASTIQTNGRGEGDPLVQTADGVREPRNRRVEISFR